MTKRFVAALSIALLVVGVWPGVVWAVGTATVTRQEGNITKYTIAWTSTAGGEVSGNAFTVTTLQFTETQGLRGRLLQVEFAPGTAGAQPSNLYDVTLVDTRNVDYLGGSGADLSNSAGSIKTWHPPVLLDVPISLDLVVANAGNVKSGTVILWVGP